MFWCLVTIYAAATIYEQPGIVEHDAANREQIVDQQAANRE
jgi:hypothetical protein